MRKLLAVGSVLAAVMVWTMAVANAQRPAVGAQAGAPGMGRLGGGPGGPLGRLGGPGGIGPILGGLDLSDDQRAQIKTLTDSEREASQAGAQAMTEARSALRAAIFANGGDSGAVAALQAKVIVAEQAQLAREVQLQQTVAGILTPEQRAKVAAPRGRGRGDGGPRSGGRR